MLSSQWDSAIDSLQKKIDQATARDEKLKKEAMKGCAAAQHALSAAMSKVNSLDSQISSLKYKLHHAKWYDWFGPAEAWGVEIGVLELAKVVADGVLSLAKLAMAGVAAVANAFPIAALDPEIIALRVAQGAIKGFQLVAVATLEVASPSPEA